MKFKKNPARVTQGMNERDDRDELIEALVDNVVADPENVHSVSVAEVENPETSDFEIEVKGKKFVVISAGPDTEFGTEDDIRSDKIESKKK